MMKRFFCYLGIGVFLASCGSQIPPDQIISQKYVHKYGFDLSEQEWDARAQEGQVIATLHNGVTITQTYENGLLHGPTAYTFPNSSTIEKVSLYNQGVLLKETLHDTRGVPMREEMYEFENRTILTLWSEKGIPLSVEEYHEDTLVSGKYYNPEHELESQVENGKGFRLKRDRTGLLTEKDRMNNGELTERTTYHPNGQVHTVSNYQNYQLHGVQQKYTISGRPLMSLEWDHGILHGLKTVYRNGLKVAEVPYLFGKKSGVELHYDDLGNLIAQIPWRDDKKHGCSKSFTEDSTDSEWFFNGSTVSARKYELLDMREQMIAEMRKNKEPTLEDDSSIQ